MTSFIKPYLSALAQIAIVAPVSIALSFLLTIASVLYSLVTRPSLPEPKTILITGSSSGIGKNLAEQYAKEGVTLILLGRNQERLNEVAELCQSKRARVFVKAIDITDKKEMKEYIQEAERKYKIDLIIANAGVNSATLGKEGRPTDEFIYELYDANITGVLNTIVPVIPLFKAKKQGQIVIVSSLMTYVVDKGAYASSKACVTHLGQCLRLELAPFNVHVNVVAPPFVPSQMTAKFIHKQPKFLVMQPDAFAALVQQQLAENRPIVAPFLPFATVVLLHTIPPALFELVYRFLNLRKQ
jgi:short-subunit dehydrogenase